MEPKAKMRLWWSIDTVAVVTGGNKGLGLSIARQLGEQGLTVVLTSRDPATGLRAVEALKGEGIDSVVFHQLEVCNSKSVEELASWIQSEFGGLDILINNAGVQCHGKSYEDCLETVETNYYGVQRVTRALLPLMRASAFGARIVNVSSQAASFEHFKSSQFKKLSNVDILSEDMLNSFVSKYLQEVKAGNWCKIKKDSPVENRYSESKLLLNVYTRILARSLSFKQPESHKIFVNAICPGAVHTDLSSFLKKNALAEDEDDLFDDVYRGCTITSVEDGASTTVWLALLPRQMYPTGRFFAGKVEISF